MIHVTGIFNFDCEYLEQIAERLTRFYGREVRVSDYESYLEPSGNVLQLSETRLANTLITAIGRVRYHLVRLLP